MSLKQKEINKWVQEKKNQKLRDSTLVFLIKKSKGQIVDMCLAMKKRGFGANRWNGVGGKIEGNETIEQAAIREAKEEIGVDVKNMEKVAELSFFFPHDPSGDQMVHVYVSENWDNEPIETEEMNPKWFSCSKIPFKEMWPDDIYWLPKMIKGKPLKGMFEFGENDVVLKKRVRATRKFK